MASSRTQQTDPLSAIRARVAEVLADAGVGAQSTLMLGFSGGLDSTVLLHVLAGLRQQMPFVLSAHHVHHGASPNADAWAEACTRQCAALDVPLAVSRITVEPRAGEGWEAAARRLRHAAWWGLPVQWWVTAHHRDDQAETVLFRLFRGAGVHGAAAMRAVDRRAGSPGRLRPLLGVSRAALAAAAEAAGLRWVEDESNADQRFGRNFLRHGVMPAVRARFPAVDDTLARAAGHFAEAAGLLDELAAQDAVRCGGSAWSRPGLQGLSDARLANLVRWRLRAMDLPMPDEARLGESLRQLRSCALSRPLCLPMGASVLHAYRDTAWLTPALPALPTAPLAWQPGAELAWGEGVVRCRPVLGAGLDVARLTAASTCEIVARWAGCRVRLPGRPRKDVRRLGQEAGWAPVERDRLPILRVDGEVAWMAGVGVAAAFACPPGADGVALTWVRPAVYSSAGATEL